jgi:hypothetical protein
VVLPQAGAEPGLEEESPALAATVESTKERTPRLDWAGLLRRTFALDVFACSRCAGRRKVLAYLTAPGGVRAILEHLQLPSPPAKLAPARGPTRVSPRVNSIRPGESVLAQDDTWAVVRVARHASIEDKQQFAETLLMCIKAGSADVAPMRKRVRLISTEEAVRENKRINDEVVEEGRTVFRWDNKRRLKNRDAKIFTSWTNTQPYASMQRQQGADRQRKVRAGQARRKRRQPGRLKRQHVEKLLADGVAVRKVAQLTGIPKSTIWDIKRKASEGCQRTRATPCGTTPGGKE